MREIRFFAGGDQAQPHTRRNSWAGTGASIRLPFWTVRLVVEGPVNPRTGYVCDIKTLDQLVLTRLNPALSKLEPTLEASAGCLPAAASEIAGALPDPLTMVSIQLRPTATTFLTVDTEYPAMLLTQSFEFSASHRLSCPGLSDAENHKLFGKCSNPHGHGHNYVVEVSVETTPADSSNQIRGLDLLVDAEIIQRFDHKNLNVECIEFRELNPTVENIAQVIFDRLAATISPIRLASVRVWETPKTYAEALSSRTGQRR